jgi:hypothetical protein
VAKRGRLRPAPDFGLDAPPIVYGYAVLGVALLVAARNSVMVGWGVWAVAVGLGVAGPMTYATGPPAAPPD